MPLYIVRWSADAASIVHAADDRDLSSIVSERTDLDAVSWDVYDGPLWLDCAVGGARTATLSPESRRATIRAVARFMTSPLAPVTSDVGDDGALCWAEAASLLEMARDAWIADMDAAQLREALRGALHRLDASDAMRLVRVRVQ